MKFLLTFFVALGLGLLFSLRKRRTTPQLQRRTISGALRWDDVSAWLALQSPTSDEVGFVADLTVQPLPQVLTEVFSPSQLVCGTPVALLVGVCSQSSAAVRTAIILQSDALDAPTLAALGGRDFIIVE